MWKLSRSRVLLDEPPEDEDGLQGGPPPAAASAASAQLLWKFTTICICLLRTWERSRDCVFLACDLKGLVPAAAGVGCPPPPAGEGLMQHLARFLVSCSRIIYFLVMERPRSV